MTFLPLLLALGLALVHFFAREFPAQQAIPRSRWLSAASGASVAYVFLHLLPELGAWQTTMDKSVPSWLSWIEQPVFLVALIGLVAFYGLERLAEQSKQGRRRRGEEPRTGRAVFRLHVAVFALYNAVIGYLLLRGRQESRLGLVLFSVAIGLHFFVSDHGLRHHHRERYDRVGRWVLSGAVIAGLLVGYVWSLDPLLIAALLGLLAGGITLNTLKEELPAERESRFPAFAFGAFLGALLLVPS